MITTPRKKYALETEKRYIKMLAAVILIFR